MSGSDDEKRFLHSTSYRESGGLVFEWSTITPKLLHRANIFPYFKSRPTPKLETGSGECLTPNQLCFWAGLSLRVTFGPL
jgi:hypothetical protein